MIEKKTFTNYANKMMVTSKQPGITIIVIDDNAKRGGDCKVMERMRAGEAQKQKENAEVWAILKGKK